MPELRLVVLATQDRLAYAPRFPEALDALLKGGTPSAAAGPAPPPATTNAGSTDIRSWVDRANQAFSEYQRLTAEGKLAEAGNKLDDLKRTLEEMRRLSSPPK